MTRIVLPHGYCFYLEDVLVVIEVQRLQHTLVTSVVNLEFAKVAQSVIILKNNKGYFSKLKQSSVVSILRKQYIKQKEEI